MEYKPPPTNESEVNKQPLFDLNKEYTFELKDVKLNTNSMYKLCGVKLKWYQKIRMWLYDRWLDCKRISKELFQFIVFGYVKHPKEKEKSIIELADFSMYHNDEEDEEEQN